MKENRNMKEKQKQQTRTWANTMYVLKFCFRHCPLYTVMSLIKTAKANFVIFLEFTLMLSFLINSIQYNGSVRDAFIFVVCVMTFKLVNSWVNSLVDSKIAPSAEAKLSAALRLELFEKASSIDLECYDDPQYYTDFVWAMSQAFDRMSKTVETVDGIIGSVALLIMTGGFMLQSDVIGIIFVALSLVLMVSLNVLLNKHKFKLDSDTKPLTRKRDYFSRVFYLNDFSKELRLYNIKDKLFKDFAQVNIEINDVIDKQTKPIALLTYIRDFLCTEVIMNGIYIIYLLYRTIVLGNLAYGTMSALFNVSYRLRQSLASFANLIPQMRQNSLYIDKYRAFLEYQIKIVSPADALCIPKDTKTLELKDVSFYYDPNKPKAVNHVSMKINAGEKIAIVGYNGAGKTTLVKLMMRLYDVTEGQILYDGVPVQQYDLTSYHEMFGTVFQDYQLFATSLEHNVTMRGGETDRQLAEHALVESGFGDRLKTLPKGLATYFSKEFEKDGINFSLGEAQKIAISRTLYKDSRIIILDEPSSALDPIAEYNLNNTILNSGSDKTMIFISHRLSTTKLADRIYMFENGGIAEHGSHDELMKLNGKYAEMFRLQSEKYQLFTEFI